MGRKGFLRDLREVSLRDIVIREVILAYELVKPASRIFIPDKIFPEFESFCSKYGLFIVKGDYKIIGNRDIGKGGWQNKIKKKVSVRSKQGTPHYYVSRNRRTAESAKDAESKKDDKWFGKKLGYPMCDQIFYNANYREANSKQCDFSLLTLRNTGKDYPYNAYNNYVAQYLGIVNNEQTSDGSGFVVITKGQSELEEVVKAVLSARIKEDIENELFYYEGKDSTQFDYSKVPGFVEKHTQRTSDREFFLRPTEEQYQSDLGFTIEDNPGGLLYNVELYDIRNIPQALKSQLMAVEPNKFIYLHEMDCQLERTLKQEIDLFF